MFSLLKGKTNHKMIKGEAEMIALETDMPGKRGFFRKLQPHLKELGFHIDEKKDTDIGSFNGILTSQGEKKIYLSLPYQIIQEELEQAPVQIEFGTPLIINHTINSDLKPFQNSFHQSDWKLAGEQAVQQIINHIDNNL